MKQQRPFGKGTAAKVNRWQLPKMKNTVTEGGLVPEGSLQPPTAAEVQAIQKQAWQEGFDQGYQDGSSKGYHSGVSAGQEVIEALSGILDTLGKPVRLLTDQVIDELVMVIRVVTRQLVRREIHQDPGQLIAVIREAVNALPFSNQQIQIRMHPEDAVIVRDVLALDGTAPIWELVEDLVLSRGDVRLVGDASQVDGRLETRLNTLITGMLGGVRQDDHIDQDSKNATLESDENGDEQAPAQ